MYNSPFIILISPPKISFIVISPIPKSPFVPKFIVSPFGETSLDGLIGFVVVFSVSEVSFVVVESVVASLPEVGTAVGVRISAKIVFERVGLVVVPLVPENIALTIMESSATITKILFSKKKNALKINLPLFVLSPTLSFRSDCKTFRFSRTVFWPAVSFSVLKL